MWDTFLLVILGYAALIGIILLMVAVTILTE